MPSSHPRPGPVATLPRSYQPLPYDGAGRASVDGGGHAGAVQRRRAPRVGVLGWAVLWVAAALTLAGIGFQVLHVAPHRASAAFAYTSGAGQFAARFPARPTAHDTVTPSATLGEVSVHVASTAAPLTIVAAEQFTRATPAARTQQVLRDELDTTLHGLALGTGTGAATTFHGRPARRVQVAGPGQEVTSALAVLWTPRRLYLLLAPAGTPFAQLTASLRISG